LSMKPRGGRPPDRTHPRPRALRAGTRGVCAVPAPSVGRFFREAAPGDA
jgi:hypothetical protein